MKMARKQIRAPLDDNSLNNINHNFEELYKNYDEVVENVSEKAFSKVVDSAKLNWKEPVATFNDLPTNAEVGETRMVRDTGKVYRYSPPWVEIQEIDAGPVNEVDSRLSAQLAQTRNLENWELNSKGREKKGITVFISDDGVITDYSVYKPIFESESVPLCLAVVSDWVGKSGYMTLEQLLEVQNELGWEILAHSKTHPTTSGGRIMIPDLPEDEARYELNQGKIDLINMGLNVQSYAHVGGQYRTRDRKLTREYFRAARTSNYGRYGINTTPIESHELKTVWLDTQAGYLKDFLAQYPRAEAIAETLRLIKLDIDRAKRENALLIISTHTRNMTDADLQQLFRDVIQYAKQETEVMTLRDALNEMGNIVEVGDFSKLSTGERAGGSHFAIGVDGKVSGGVYLADNNEFDGNTEWEDFPIGITICNITSNIAVSSGLPEGRPGQITNYRTYEPQTGFNYQLYRLFRSNKVYKRDVDGDGKYGSWYLDSQGVNIDNQSNFRMNAGIDSYGLGITYTRVLSSHTEDIANAPEQRPGLRITHKITETDTWAMNFQEYHLNYDSGLRVYKRVAKSATEWGEWVLIK